jgi:hypothetical protein
LVPPAPLPPWSWSPPLLCLALKRESGIGLVLTISLATMLKLIREKFRSMFIFEGGGGVLATLSGYTVSFPHFVTAKRMCLPWYNSSMPFRRTTAPFRRDTSSSRSICSSRALSETMPVSSPTSTSASRTRDWSTLFLSTTIVTFPTSLTDCEQEKATCGKRCK